MHRLTWVCTIGTAAARYSANTVATLRRMDPDKINYELLTAVVAWICKSGGPGAVLVFMPGLMEITTLHTALSANPVIKAATRNGAFLIAMHSALSSAQQNAAFSIPPDGVRKVGHTDADKGYIYLRVPTSL